ncbi:dethiobiotin synthase [Nocardioides litoris]|uniref:dethiobiotin synthase n=1 Tax=Nocardioides litoris TaxID=1926648 RepID=UPI00111E0671|nr:dethiobiotin synthase [Nocardioides litoris]
MSGGPRFVVVTGTGTEVGKTVTTAALAAVAAARGDRVLVVKPVQTGIAGDEPRDADVVAHLAGPGVDVTTFTELAEPLAPDTAARRAGVDLPPVADHAARVRDLASAYDVVVVEGAGGLLVRLDTDGGTLLDLAAALDDPQVVVVCAPALGTLNTTELTVGALRARGLEPAGLVIGSWPDDPGLAESVNAEELPRVSRVPLWGRVPAGSGALDPAAFRAAAPGWLPGAP